MAFRTALGSVRRFSANAAQVGDHGEGTRMWKILTLAVALPSVAVTYVYANMNEKEDHEAHMLNGRDEFIAYDHLRRRTKKFPWGDGNHGLFHNPQVNPLPDGYEEEQKHHH